MRLKIERSKNEDSLVTDCRQADPIAQRTVYEKYSGKMLGVCNRYIRDRSEAEVVMIGGFVKVFNRIDQFKGEGSFEGWVRRIMVNESLVFLRKNRNMYLEVDIENADNDVDIHSMATNLETEDLLRMVKELPYGYRTVFNMYAIEGYSHKEIAEKLGININTSKSQLSRARKLLQAMLAKSEKIAKAKTVEL